MSGVIEDCAKGFEQLVNWLLGILVVLFLTVIGLGSYIIWGHSMAKVIVIANCQEVLNVGCY